MKLEQIAARVDRITQEFETINGLRDDTLERSRALVRSCAQSIRAIHRHEFAEAESMLAQARQDALIMVEPLADFPYLYHAGYTQDALKELVEAHLVYAFVADGDMPTPDQLFVTGATYLNGMSEAATEMRRFVLDLMRRNEVEAAEPYLTIMDEIYTLLSTVDFPDAVTGGLRRQTDILRSVLERTRGDLTVGMRQEQLQAALQRFEEMQVQTQK
ncbi:MAG: haloacid dehalogenase [Caldilineaceae bacterium]|nr:haloacid dehalogenase [Caldilineaceae bacterium]